MDKIELDGMGATPTNSPLVGNIVKFPAMPANHRNRGRVVAWLRQMAEYIENDLLTSEPHAVAIVLTGAAVHEVLFHAYEGDKRGLMEASACLYQYTKCPSREGENLFDRSSAPLDL